MTTITTDSLIFSGIVKKKPSLPLKISSRRVPEFASQECQFLYPEPVPLREALWRGVSSPEAGPLSQGQLQLDGGPTRHPQPDEAEGGGVEVSGGHQRVKDTPSNGLTTGKGQSLKSSWVLLLILSSPTIDKKTRK